MSPRLSYPRCALVGLALLATGAECRLYRWVDEAGAVHYTDTLPPTQAGRGFDEIDDRGVVVGTTDPAKTPEEIRRDAEVQKSRDAVDRAKKQRVVADRALLQAYRSVDEMVTARDGRIAPVDAMIQVLRSNIRRQQDSLRGLHAAAADLERAGKPIPPNLSEGINKIERGIRDAYSAVLGHEQRKQELYAGFGADIRRFRQLTGLPEAKAGDEDLGKRALQYVVSCPSVEACDLTWARATAYVREHARMPIQVARDTVLITAAPEGPDDIGLALSRIQEGEGEGGAVFLDVRCKSGPNGDATCRGPEARGILDRFHDAVTGPAADPAPDR
jgi:hypothetical protein